MKLRLLLLAGVLAASIAVAAPATAAPGDPEVKISSPSNNSTHKTTPTINYTSSGTGVSRACTLTIWDEPVGCNAASWNPGPLADGVYTARIMLVKDDAPVASDSVTFRVDSTPPTITITRSPDSEYTNAATTSATAVVTDATPNTLDCWLPGLGWMPCPGGTATSGTITLNHADDALGSASYNFRATDRAGNQTTLAHSHYVDRIPPQIQLTAQWGALTNDATPEFLIWGSDMTGVGFTCSIDFAAPLHCSGPNWSTPELGEGAHVLVITGRDAAGNSASAAHNFTVDLTPPAVVLTALSGVQTKDTTPSFGIAASDDHGLNSQTCGIDNEWVDGVECADQFTAGELAVGQHTFFHEISDEAGNVQRSSLQFEIVADPPPGQENPGENPGEKPAGDKGNPPAAPAVAVRAKSSKVRKGRFTTTIIVTLRGAAAISACGARATLTLAPKVKKAKRIKRSLAMKVSNGACVGKVKLKLAGKFRGKKTGVRLSHAGAPQFAAVAFGGTLRRL